MSSSLASYVSFRESALIANATDSTLLKAHLSSGLSLRYDRLTSLVLLAQLCLTGVKKQFAYVKSSNSLNLYPSSFAFVDSSSQLQVLTFNKVAGKGRSKKVLLYNSLTNGASFALVTQRKGTSLYNFKHEFQILTTVSKIPSPYIASELFTNFIMLPAKNNRPDTPPLQKGAFLMRGFSSNVCHIPASQWHSSCLKCVSHVAQAVFSLHNSGLIHGDIRAENVLIDQNHVFKLGDFGSASFKGVANVYIGEGELPPEVIPNTPFIMSESFDYWGLGLFAITFAYPSEPYWYLRHQFSEIREQRQMDQAIQELREIILKNWPDPTDSGRICRLQIVNFADHLLKIDPAKRMLVLLLLHDSGNHTPSAPPLLEVPLNPN
ncbi:MAG: protein kinase [Chlamydiia bacterium]|nr:protein kinase [Chlamydiia bacterium]